MATSWGGNFTEAKLDNGETVRIAVPPGMSEDEAGVRFMQAYNANKAAFHAPVQQAQAQPATAATAPNQPSWGNISDVSKSLLSSIPAGVGNTSNFLNEVVPGKSLRDLAYQKLFGKNYGDVTNAVTGALGGGYQPETPAGQFVKAAGGGAISGALTGGEGIIPEALYGALSGLAGQAGTNVGGKFTGEVSGAVPYLARALLNVANPKGAVTRIAREDIGKTSPQEMDYARQLQTAAQETGTPTMAWQSFPPGSAIRRGGEEAATMPGSTTVQEKLRELQGGAYEFDPTTGKPMPVQPHVGADTLETAAMMGEAGSPEHTMALAHALRVTDQLRNAGKGEMATAGPHEMQNIALGLHALDAVAPGIAAPVKAVVGAGHGLAAMGAIRRAMGGSGAIDELYSAPSIEEFQRLAAEDPRLVALRQLAQSYLVPATGQATETKGR